MSMMSSAERYALSRKCKDKISFSAKRNYMPNNGPRENWK